MKKTSRLHAVERTVERDGKVWIGQLIDDPRRITFGQRVKGFRRERGLTVRVMAERLGVSHSYMTQMESGKRFPSDQLLKRMAVFMSADISIRRRVVRRFRWNGSREWEE